MRLPPFETCVVEGRVPRLDGSDPLLVGFSVRNRAFRREFFDHVIQLCENSFKELEIVIVDLPYAYNDAARRGDSAPSSKEIEIARKTGDERASMIAKAVARQQPRKRVRTRRWDEVSAGQDVAELRGELDAAYHRRGLVYKKLVDYSHLWAQGAQASGPDNYTAFLLEEFPVFVKLYYVDGLSTDIYPGRNFDFFMHLEDGKLAEELPLSTKLAGGRPLSFLNVGYSSADL